MRYSFDSWKRERWTGSAALPAALAAALFAFYLAALPPTFVTPRAAESAAASFTLGAAPPPGNPVWLLAGKAWATALPMGSVAFRYNLLSALCAALAAAGVFMLGRNLGAGIVLSLAGALAFGFSLTAWRAAGEAGAGAFDTLLLVLALAAFQKWNVQPSNERLAALGLACGVLTAENLKFLPVALVLLAVAAWKGLRQESEGGKGALSFGIPALAGLLLLAVTPLRETAGAETGGFVRRAANWEAWSEDERASLGDYGRSLLHEATLPGAALALAGFVGLAWASPALASGAALVMAADAVGGVFLSSATEAPEFSAAAALALCLSVAGAGVLLFKMTFPFMAYVRPWAFLALALPAALLAARAPSLRAEAGNFVLYDAALEMFHAADEGGILLASGDVRMAALAYMRGVERRRPDLRVVAPEGASETEEALFRRALDGGEPLYAMSPSGGYALPSPYAFAPAGPLYRLTGVDDPAERAASRTFYRFVLRGGEDVGSGDARTWAALAMREAAWGEFLWSAGRWEEGTDLLRRAARMGSGDPAVQFGVGMSFLIKARHVEAAEAFENAVRLAPRNAEMWRRLGMAREQRGMSAEAVAAFEKARDIEPERAEAHAMLGDALRRAERHKEALPVYRRALELAPHRAGVRIHFADILAGEGHFTEAVKTLEQGTLLPDAPMEVWERLALVHEATGRIPQSIGIWREVERRGDMNWVEHAKFEQERLRDLMARGDVQ